MLSHARPGADESPSEYYVPGKALNATKIMMHWTVLAHYDVPQNTWPYL